MLSDAVLDHFQSPRNAGKLPNATASVDVTNPVCGDILYLAARLEPQTNRIAEARFLCQGCTTAIACASLLTVEIKNKTIPEAARINADYLSHSTKRLTSRHSARRTISRRRPRPIISQIKIPLIPLTSLRQSIRIIQIQNAAFRR